MCVIRKVIIEKHLGRHWKRSEEDVKPSLPTVAVVPPAGGKAEVQPGGQDSAIRTRPLPKKSRTSGLLHLLSLSKQRPQFIYWFRSSGWFRGGESTEI